MSGKFVHGSRLDQTNAGFDAIKARVDAVEPVGMFRHNDVNVSNIAPHLGNGRFKTPHTRGHFGQGIPQAVDFGVDVAQIAKDQVFGFVSHRVKIDGFANLSTRRVGK